MRGATGFDTCFLSAGAMQCGNYSAFWGQSGKRVLRRTRSSHLSSTSQRPGPRGWQSECCPPDPLGNAGGTRSRRWAQAFRGTCGGGSHKSSRSCQRSPSPSILSETSLGKVLYLKNASCSATCMNASGLIFCFLMNSFP